MKAFASEENKETQPKEMKVVEEVKPQNNSLFQFGDGSEENPYQVSTAEQLDAVRNDLTAHYIQTADIDLSGIEWIPIGGVFKDWRPIGLKTENNPFKGTYLGQNHWIKNLSINSSQSHLSSYGLFGSIQNATINDLNITLNIILNDLDAGYGVDVGGIVGVVGGNDSYLNNCNVYGSIQIEYDGGKSNGLYVGGITGSGGNLDSCNNNTNIKVSSFTVVRVGGLTGVTGKIINDCNNFGGIDVEYHGQSTVENYIGGLGGRCSDYNKVEVDKCNNYGNINVSGSAFFKSAICVGGLFGFGYATEISNSNNNGELNVKRKIWELSTILSSNGYEGFGLSLFVGGLIGKISLGKNDEVILKGCENLSTKIDVILESTLNYPLKQVYGDISVGGIAGIDLDQRAIVNNLKDNPNYIERVLDRLNQLELRIDAKINNSATLKFINATGYPLPNLALFGKGYNHKITNADSDLQDKNLNMYEGDIQYITKTFTASSPESLKDELSKITIFNDNPELVSIESSGWDSDAKKGSATTVFSVKALKGGLVSVGLKLGDEILSQIDCKVIPKFTLSENKITLDKDVKEVKLTAESEFISAKLAEEILDSLKWNNHSLADIELKKEFKDGKIEITFTLYPSTEVYKDETSSLVIKNLGAKDIVLEIFQKGHFEYKEIYQIINSLGFRNSMVHYLTKDGNFTSSLLVSEKDPKFGTILVKAFSNLYFRGLDGWKEIISNEASKDIATDILIGYIYNSSKVVSGMSGTKESFTLIKKLNEALDWYFAKQMNNHLEDSGMLKELSTEISSLKDSSQFTNALISGDIEKLSEVLIQHGSSVDVKKMSEFF